MHHHQFDPTMMKSFVLLHIFMFLEAMIQHRSIQWSDFEIIP